MRVAPRAESTGDAMTTKLEAPLKREIEVAGKAYTLTLTPRGFKLVPKGHRKGQELSWEGIVNAGSRGVRCTECVVIAAEALTHLERLSRAHCGDSVDSLRKALPSPTPLSIVPPIYLLS